MPPSLLGTRTLWASVPLAVTGLSGFCAATAKVFRCGDLAASNKLRNGASGFKVGPVAVVGRLVG